METKRKSMYVSEKTLKRFKIYCVTNGFKMGFVIDKVINEWLDENEKK